MALKEATNFIKDAGLGISGSIAERGMCTIAVADIKRRLSQRYEAHVDGTNLLPGRNSITLLNREYSLTFTLPAESADAQVFPVTFDPKSDAETQSQYRQVITTDTPVYQITQLTREEGGLLIKDAKRLPKPQLRFQIEEGGVSYGYVISGHELYKVKQLEGEQPDTVGSYLTVIKTPHPVTANIMDLVLNTLAHGIEENLTFP